jgi:hypothetical protein
LRRVVAELGAGRQQDVLYGNHVLGGQRVLRHVVGKALSNEGMVDQEVKGLRRI